MSAGAGGAELRRGPWKVEEDTMLIHYIASHGEGNWNLLARYSGLRRTGKSCRLRWLNYLKPGVRRGNLTPQEKSTISDLHSKWGNRWSKIAQHLPGRTDNEIKNYWRTRVQDQARPLKHAESERFLVSKNEDTTKILNCENAGDRRCNSSPPPKSSGFPSQGGGNSNSMLLPQLKSVSDHPVSPIAADMYYYKCPSDPECYYSLEDLRLATSSPLGADDSGLFPGCLAVRDDDTIDTAWNTDELWQF